MGQVCTSTSRIFVQDTVYEEFLNRLVQYTKESTIMGSPFDPQVTHGPQISQVQQKKILDYVDIAKSEGAELVLGGYAPSGSGFFVYPTIFTSVRNSMRVAQEEIFGPFVVIQKFCTEKEVIEKANDTEYGLGAAVFTTNITAGHRMAAAIEAGMVWVRKPQVSLPLSCKPLKESWRREVNQPTNRFSPL